MGVKRIIGETPRNKRKKQRVNPTILIISEGKDTEVNYFKRFNQKYVNVDVKIAEKNSAGKNRGKQTDPVNLVEKAIEYMKLKYDIREEDGDRVWCLMDVDLNLENPDPVRQKTEEIEKAYKRARDYSKNAVDLINLGISNPCFELWYLLHFVYTTANFKNYSSIKDRLEKDTPLKDYEKNKCVYNVIHHNTPDAIKNAISLRKHHEELGINFTIHSIVNIKGIVESNPFTNIDVLVKYIEALNALNSNGTAI